MELVKGKEYTIYVTKYALTAGIHKKRVYYTGIGEMMADLQNRFTQHYHGRGKDWHFKYEDALKRAETMQQRKIASLEKQLKKFRGLKFEAVED